MTSETVSSLPPKNKEEAVKTPRQPRNTAIDTRDYFNTIEKLCEEKEISPENLEQFFRVHWLRNAVGGSFSRAQEMFDKYKNYVDTVPEEARQLAVPEGIHNAVNDLMSFVSWFYRMSYDEIQNDKVKEVVQQNQTLQEEITRTLTRLDDAEARNLSLSEENSSLQTELAEQQNAVRELQESLQESRGTVATVTRQRDDAISELRLLQQSAETLTQQLNERKQELASQLDYQKKLIEENRSQQTEINGLTNQCDQLKLSVSDLMQKLDAQTKTLTEAQACVADLEQVRKTLVQDLEQTRAERVKASEENEHLKSEVQQLNGELQEQARTQTSMTRENQQLKEEVMSLKATLTAEKTIADSLRGTLDSLTSAMAGGSSGKSKQRTKKSD
ncbi:ATP/GTP-binding protein [Escherichia coli]|nr:ATP/GTP-binding protein [Escherichia coli]